MRMHRLSIPGLSIFTYLLIDQETDRCAVVDPVRNIEPLLQLAAKEELQITDVFETHVHADFLSGAKELKHRLGNAVTLHCSGMGGPEWTPKYADKLLNDRDEVSLGTVRIQAWHTPGHSPEHVSYIIFDDLRDTEHPCAALTGDFLFVGSLGRPDLLGEESLKIMAKKLYHSVTKVLPELPDYLEIFPAHGAGSFCGKGIGGMNSSTLGYERQANPLLQQVNEIQWMEKLLEYPPRTPRYFARIKKLNVQGPQLLATMTPPRAMSIEEVAKLDVSTTQLLDVRGVEAFSAAFFTGSLNIPLAGSFAMWVAEFTLPEIPIVLIGSSDEEMTAALSLLRLIGLDQVVGYCLLAEQFGTGLSTILLEEPEVVAKQMEEYLILDVRTSAEWANGHIPEAMHVELSVLPSSLKLIPREKPIYTMCAMGQRASIAASFLRKAGFEKVGNIRGGMTAWDERVKEEG